MAEAWLILARHDAEKQIVLLLVVSGAGSADQWISIARPLQPLLERIQDQRQMAHRADPFPIPAFPSGCQSGA
jgi:hypothetical protein